MDKWESLKLANEQYMETNLKKVLKPLTKALLKEKPGNVLDFIIDWAQKEKEAQTNQSERNDSREPSDYSDALPTSDSEDEEISDSEFEKMKFNRDTQRQSVSGETFVPDENYVPIMIEKPESVRKMLLEKLDSIFMFSTLENDEKEKVVDAIRIKKVTTGEKVIVEGDEGNELFAVGQGKLRYARFPGFGSFLAWLDSKFGLFF